MISGFLTELSCQTREEDSRSRLFHKYDDHQEDNACEAEEKIYVRRGNEWAGLILTSYGSIVSSAIADVDSFLSTQRPQDLVLSRPQLLVHICS